MPRRAWFCRAAGALALCSTAPQAARSISVREPVESLVCRL